jgi:hypothetical protein
MAGPRLRARDPGPGPWPSNGIMALAVQTLREGGSPCVAPDIDRRNPFLGSGRLTVVIHTREGPIGPAIRTECHARERMVPRTGVAAGLE